MFCCPWSVPGGWSCVGEAVALCMCVQSLSRRAGKSNDNYFYQLLDVDDACLRSLLDPWAYISMCSGKLGM